MKHAITLALAASAITIAAPANAIVYGSTIVASGLNNPRGLAFGPDGGLYIAEAGVVQLGGPTTVTRGFTFSLSDTGSITRVLDGVQERVVTGIASLGSTQTNETTGAADIAFGADGTAYLLMGYIGDPAARATDLGPAGLAFGTLHSFADGSVTPLVDLTTIEAEQNPAGREINSNPYHLIRNGNELLVTDAGSNTLLRLGDSGAPELVATFPARFIAPPPPLTDAVPTGVAVGPDGNYYVAELTGFPFAEGAAQIYRVAPDGGYEVAYSGFTNISDIAFGEDGSLYVLELDSNGLTTPGGGGALIRVAADGTQETIFASGLITPIGLEIGADGAFYVTNFSAAEGIGQVLRIAAVPEPASWAMMIAGFGLVGGAMRRRGAVGTAFA